MAGSIYGNPVLRQKPTAASLLEDLRSGDLAVRERAVLEAPLVGTPLMEPLGDLMGGPDPAAARAAQEALRRVAHNCGRPGAGRERAAAVRALMTLTQAGRPRHVRAEAIYLLGCLATSRETAPLRRLASDPDLGRDAEAALQRIPRARR